MASLALLIHVSEQGTEGEVSEYAAEKAIAWCEYPESHARRVYSLVEDHTLGAKTLLKRMGVWDFIWLHSKAKSHIRQPPLGGF